jgi:hypothetical protein
MALQDNAARSSAGETTSVNHPAQSQGVPAHHGTTGKHAKNEHGEHGHGVEGRFTRSGSKMEQMMGVHKKGSGLAQVGYGRPC